MSLSKCRGADYQSASEYLKRRYETDGIAAVLPLPDEPFAALWRERIAEYAPPGRDELRGRSVLDFLTDGLGLGAYDFMWKNIDALSVAFAGTLAGRLPVISTESHEDFRSMEALTSGRETARELPPTVNAFTIQARAEAIFRHRVILLNRAPYSNIPASSLKIPDDEWLLRSHRLRLRHESAHYETLRLFGDMQNHALDEITADALGQIAAFGSFDADRQRLFFGLTRGEGICRGRLSFYCGKVRPEEREEVYRAVDNVLDIIADEVNELSASGASELELLKSLAGRSIAERLP